MDIIFKLIIGLINDNFKHAFVIFNMSANYTQLVKQLKISFLYNSKYYYHVRLVWQNYSFMPGKA